LLGAVGCRSGVGRGGEGVMRRSVARKGGEEETVDAT